MHYGIYQGGKKNSKKNHEAPGWGLFLVSKQSSLKISCSTKLQVALIFPELCIQLLVRRVALPLAESCWLSAESYWLSTSTTNPKLIQLVKLHFYHEKVPLSKAIYIFIRSSVLPSDWAHKSVHLGTGKNCDATRPFLAGTKSQFKIGGENGSELHTIMHPTGPFRPVAFTTLTYTIVPIDRVCACTCISARYRQHHHHQGEQSGVDPSNNVTEDPVFVVHTETNETIDLIIKPTFTFYIITIIIIICRHFHLQLT